mmetsp:Transcript_112592/g.318025  ORF Transcript_112592/g.318025 Transcript_112592/m.318025 type:complete len:287 (+) Transcript_112592:454-1314(+)
MPHLGRGVGRRESRLEARKRHVRSRAWRQGLDEEVHLLFAEAQAKAQEPSSHHLRRQAPIALCVEGSEGRDPVQPADHELVPHPRGQNKRPRLRIHRRRQDGHQRPRRMVVSGALRSASGCLWHPGPERRRHTPRRRAWLGDLGRGQERLHLDVACEVGVGEQLFDGGPVLRFLRQHPPYQIVQLLRVEAWDRLVVVTNDLVNQAHERRGLKGVLEHTQLVEHASQRPNVRLVPVRLVAADFGAHVVGRANHRHGGIRGAFKNSGDAEIAELDGGGASGEKYVGGL